MTFYQSVLADYSTFENANSRICKIGSERDPNDQQIWPEVFLHLAQGVSRRQHFRRRKRRQKDVGKSRPWTGKHSRTLGTNGQRTLPHEDEGLVDLRSLLQEDSEAVSFGR